MDRILQHTSATIRVAVTVAGEDTDPSPDAATVTVTHADGTVIADTVEALNDGTGTFAYPLAAANTGALGLLEAVWAFTLSGQAQQLTTVHEIVGGYHFPLAEFLARYPEIAAKKTPAEITAARALAEDALEHACGVAFVPRGETRRLRRGPGGLLRVPRREFRRLTTALDSDDAAIDITDVDITGRWVTNTASWPTGRMTISYEHGMDRPPARVAQASMLLTKAWLMKGPIDDRATQQINVETGGTINLATPGMFGQTFGLPEVDAVVRDYERKAYVR